MLDSFDHRKGEEPSDERSSLLGEDTKKRRREIGKWGGRGGVLGRSCSDESVMSKIDSPETVLRKNGSPMSSPSVEESTTSHALALVGEGRMEMNEWQCDYPSCGRLFQKRHDLK